MTNESLSLVELNSLVRQSIKACLPEYYWVKAELSDVRQNSSGHCFVELVQKSSRGDSLIAKARGNIWSNVFTILKPYFEEATGQAFTNGINVLVKVSVDFHELYGYSLTVVDIDPTYTIGDMARRRKEILQQLEAEGVLNLNKELEIPMLPQRVAVISSATAAGYGDFSNQLLHNAKGYQFYISLFPAIMQGDRVEESVIAALDKINGVREHYDVVVIIRGGGATSDLSGFDTYNLAVNCVQFPLPIITGIGHERDDTVIDMISNTRVKTPTAAAALLIDKLDSAAAFLQGCSDSIKDGAEKIIDEQTGALSDYRQTLYFNVQEMIKRERYRWQSLSVKISTSFTKREMMEENNIIRLNDRIRMSIIASLDKEKHRLEMYDNSVRNSLPENILKKGYSITMHQGKVVKDLSSLNEGDELRTVLYNGEIKSIVTKK